MSDIFATATEERVQSAVESASEIHITTMHQRCIVGVLSVDPRNLLREKLLQSPRGSAGEVLHGCLYAWIVKPVVVEVIGGGGMGIVYKADDLRLGRHVALKFLSQELVDDPISLERFEREARAASALDHPNICPIYEFGEHAGQPFLAMQLLNGQTLRERLACSRLSNDELLRVAVSICDGLDAAHRKGIIHRDIKPANIFITDREVVKILDFGLAKLSELSEVPELADRANQQGEGSDIPPRLALTRTGVALGTAHYMSPEQVRGEPLDACTDIFSIGLVLYEMATGKQAFTGDTVQVVHEAIINRAPAPVRELEPTIPQRLEDIINKAIEKDREQRYQSAALMQHDLQGLPERSPATLSTARYATRFTSTKRLALLLSFFSLVVAAGIFWLNLRSLVPKVIDSVQITRDGLSKDFVPLIPFGSAVSLLTDGTRLYFPESLPGGTALAQVSTHGGEIARMRVSLQEPIAYDISPTRLELLVGEGTFRGADAERPLWVLSLPGGPLHRVGGILAHDACWAPDGLHFVYLNDKDLLMAKPDGSEVRKLATADGFPQLIRFSPDGARLRFNVVGAESRAGEWDIFEIKADGSGMRRLPIRGYSGRWSADGKYYFYQADRDIWVLPERRSVFSDIKLGTPMQLTTGPMTFSMPVPSGDGKQLFVIGNQQQVELVRYDNKSNRFVPFLGGISAGELEVSPDGQWVAYTTYPESNLWRSRLDGSERLQLTFPPQNVHEPRWSPDGKKILFTDEPLKIFVVSAEGGNPQQLMPWDHPTVIGAGAWLPDGNSIAFVRVMGCPDQDSSCAEENAAIYLFDLKTQQVSKLPGSDKMAASRVSPNGRYMIAHATDQNKLMLYDFQSQRWSEFAQGRFDSVTWSHDSKFAYLKRADELVRMSVPDGKIQHVLDLRGISFGGRWPGWISLLPDDSPLLTLDKSTQEIYRLELQFR